MASEQENAFSAINGTLMPVLTEIANIATEESNPNKTLKARRIRFYHNGNKYFNGIVVPVSSERYRTFGSLTTDLSNILTSKVPLPHGVRNIYSMDGQKVFSIDELEDGKAYVCSGNGEAFKPADYGKTEALKVWRTTSAGFSMTDDSSTSNLKFDCVKPRFVTIVPNGVKPRRVFRIFLNKRNASTIDQLLKTLTDAARLDSGAVRKVFTRSGQMVTSLSQIYSDNSDGVFFVYGNEKHVQDDFKLTSREDNTVQSLRKMPRGSVTSYKSSNT